MPQCRGLVAVANSTHLSLAGREEGYHQIALWGTFFFQPVTQQALLPSSYPKGTAGVPSSRKPP